MGDKDEVLEIQKEIEMLKECNHPNVVRYLVSPRLINSKILYVTLSAEEVLCMATCTPSMDVQTSIHA